MSKNINRIINDGHNWNFVIVERSRYTFKRRGFCIWLYVLIERASLQSGERLIIEYAIKKKSIERISTLSSLVPTRIETPSFETGIEDLKVLKEWLELCNLFPHKDYVFFEYHIRKIETELNRKDAVKKLREILPNGKIYSY